ncbi:MAG: aspartate dehydrogenase [Tissierellia bacterium]|nr:aspartate dehydrogenase [Tissierellia bacterium]
MRKYKLGLIGSGSLGSIIANSISKDLKDDYDLIGILSSRVENAEKLASKVQSKAYIDLDELINDKPDYIIEAASPNVVKDCAFKILDNGINLIILSVGAFADNAFYNEVEKIAKKRNCRVHLASGAVGGFDVLSSAMLIGNSSVRIITEKSPNSLNGAPFLQGRNLSEENIEEVFEGTAKEAIEVFPKNVNVAVATGLATVGVDNINVIIRSVPGMLTNRHNIILEGDTVKISVNIDSRPSPDNPKSSSLAAWSVISLLKRLISPITF